MAITNFGELKTAMSNHLNRSDLDSRIPEFIKAGEDLIGQDLRIRAMEASIPLVLTNTTTDATVGGTGNVITLTNTTTKTSNTLGDRYGFEVGTINTSSVTINVDGIGAVAYNKGDGSEALEANDLPVGLNAQAYFDGTRFRNVERGQIPLPSRWLSRRRIYIAGDPNRSLDYQTPENFWSKHLSSAKSKPKAYTVEGEFITFGPAPDSAYFGRLLYWRRFASLSSNSDTNWIIDNAYPLILNASLVMACMLIGGHPMMGTWSSMYDHFLEKVKEADKKDRHGAGGALVMSSDVPADSR
jgi:hypothetical protein